MRTLHSTLWSAAMATAFIIAVCACGSSRVASSKDYGASWPFTIRSGTLRCQGPGSVTIETDDKTYAVNGVASGYAADKGWADVNDIWANGPDVAGFGMKKDLGAVIEDGLALCDGGEGSLAVSGEPGKIGKDPNAIPSEKDQQAMGFHTFSDFTPEQSAAYVAAYHACTAEFDAGTTPDPQAAGAEAEAAHPGTEDAAFEGCSDAVSGTPITGSGIEPPP
jgi:hypothetical protein